MNINRFIDHIFTEDIGSGDHTSLACISPAATGTAQLLVKDNGILAGITLAKHIFERIDPNLQLNILLKDGTVIEKGDIAFTVSGKVLSILKTERLVLNCMQRMSGIATYTNQYVQAIAGFPSKILDTRKTTPGFRYIEKWAVRIGGGYNHRMGLYDMIMIKDNHQDFCGGITNAIQATQKYLKDNDLNIKVELEIRNLTDLQEAIEVGYVDRVLLDNMSPETTKKAVEMVDGRFELESSGGITLDTVSSYAATGVDYISVGALTHSYPSLDLSLKAI